MPNNTSISRRQFALGLSAMLPAAIVGSFPSTVARSQTPMSTTEGTSMESFEQLVQWLTDEADSLGVPGVAVGVVSGSHQMTQGIGVANADPGDAFTPATPFGIASLTKIFTANALASLAHEGDVNLDDPVKHYLPGFNLEDDEATDTVTIRHLLSHTGGWADILEPNPEQESFDWYISNMAELPQVAPVGSLFSYSNSGFMVAGAVIESVTGIRYEDVISESITQRLGMQNSGFVTDADTTTDLATGHDFADDGLVTIPATDVPRAAAPAAGLYSTLEDMLTFVSAHASIEPVELNIAALKSMRDPVINGGAVGPIVVDHIGTGWMLLEANGETVLMSQGGDAGRMSAMIAVPSRKFGMVVFANSESAMMLVNEAVLRGLSMFTGLSLPEPEAHFLTDDEATRAVGQYGLPGWMTFEITTDNESLVLETSAGDEAISDLSGPLTMTSATEGYLSLFGGKVWLDLVPDSDGVIQWVRFAGRLVPRSE